MHKIDHIVNLLKDYLTGDLDVQQANEVERLLTEHPSLRKIVRELDHENNLRKALHGYTELYTDTFREREERVLKEVLSRIKDEPSVSQPSFIRRRLTIYVSVAAVTIAVLFAAIIWQKKITVPPSPSAEEIINTFTPGGNKAALILSSGQQINLSDTYSGIVIDRQIGYDDGTSVFEEGSIAEDEVLTLSTPRGGQYQVTLSDGTKVWLNAESKLRYPYRFSREIRSVELEGEAYFEVAHQKDAPFIVKTAKEKIEVLGTHFNVNSYQTDINSTVALLEGKVKVSSDEDHHIVLKPGQQSVVRRGKMEIRSVNVDECVAWKNGEFMFNNETLENVMKKVARWYDLDIELSSNLKNVEIWGSVSRYDNFNTVLKLIKMTDDRIRFEVTGRRVRFVK